MENAQSMTHRRLAIVDDSDEDIERLTRSINRYAQEKKIVVQVTTYKNGIDFLQEYRPVFDVVFLDVEMPHLDGMNTAKKLREIDGHVALVFVTRMAQYAVSGYSVAAMDFIVKPIRYGVLMEKLDHVFRTVDREVKKDAFIFLSVGTDAYRKFSYSDIYYITKDKNYILYVTRSGEYRVRGTLKEVEETFAGSSIVKCSKGVLVNLAHIEQKVKNTIDIAGIRFVITKPYLEEFTRAFMQFLRGGNPE